MMVMGSELVGVTAHKSEEEPDEEPEDEEPEDEGR